MSKLVSNDTKYTLLVDHYKDTQRVIELQTQNRDKNFYYILILLGVMAFRFFSPQISSSILNEFFKKQFGIETFVSTNYIGSLVWFILLATSIRYFQIVVNLEKLFNYIHSLEDQLSKIYNSKAYTREGKAYLYNYPKFSDWLHFLYRCVFPVLFIISVIVKLYSEWKLPDIKVESLCLNSVIAILLLISTILYLLSLRSIGNDSEKKL